MISIAIAISESTYINAYFNCRLIKLTVLAPLIPLLLKCITAPRDMPIEITDKNTADASILTRDGYVLFYATSGEDGLPWCSVSRLQRHQKCVRGADNQFCFNIGLPRDIRQGPEGVQRSGPTESDDRAGWV